MPIIYPHTQKREEQTAVAARPTFIETVALKAARMACANSKEGSPVHPRIAHMLRKALSPATVLAISNQDGEIIGKRIDAALRRLGKPDPSEARRPSLVATQSPKKRLHKR